MYRIGSWARWPRNGSAALSCGSVFPPVALVHRHDACCCRATLRRVALSMRVSISAEIHRLAFDFREAEQRVATDKRVAECSLRSLGCFCSQLNAQRYAVQTPSVSIMAHEGLVAPAPCGFPTAPVASPFAAEHWLTHRHSRETCDVERSSSLPLASRRSSRSHASGHGPSGPPSRGRRRTLCASSRRPCSRPR